MDRILLEYLLRKNNISIADLCSAMAWSEGTRQTRVIRGENWRVDEVIKLLELGLTRSDIEHIFLPKKSQT